MPCRPLFALVTYSASDAGTPDGSGERPTRGCSILRSDPTDDSPILWRRPRVRKATGPGPAPPPPRVAPRTQPVYFWVMRPLPLLLALTAITAGACVLDPEHLLPPVAPGHPLAYVSAGLAGRDDIYLLSADASTDEDVTEFTAYDSWPSWSPDGTTLAFESNRDDSAFSEVYVLSLSTRFVSRLTDDTGHADAQPAWSPLGNRIAFVSDRDSAGFDIYLMNATGGSATRLTTDSANDAQPSWSPDGAHIAFASDRDGPIGVGEIYVMDSAGGNLVNLTNDPANDLTPAWSPDGTKIAFMSTRDGIGFAVWVMDADGSNPVQISPSDPPCELPSWTPDGLRIAFDCDADIWVANADGSGLTRITQTTNLQRSEVMPRWKPVP